MTAIERGLRSGSRSSVAAESIRMNCRSAPDADLPAVLGLHEMLLGYDVRTVARFEHRVIAFHLDFLDLLAPRLALRAGAHLVTELLEAFFAEGFHHALQILRLLGRHIRPRSVHASGDQPFFVAKEGFR